MKSESDFYCMMCGTYFTFCECADGPITPSGIENTKAGKELIKASTL